MTPSRRDDVPARIVAAAATWLPAHRTDWGRAMAAELVQVHGQASRWRFAAGTLRVALFLPSGRGRRMLAVALVGLVLFPLVLCLLALTAVTPQGGSIGRDPGDSVTSMLR